MWITPFGRWSIAAIGVVFAGLAVAATLNGASMFSAGPLHAGDSTSATLGGVRAHAELANDCASCHPAPWAAATMNGRCLACHTDIQRARRDTSTVHGRVDDVTACRSCHTEHHGPRGALTRLDGSGVAHEAFGFALTAHRETADGGRFACADCHPGDGYRFEPDGCTTCHRAYQRDFVTRHVADWGDDCMACHDGRDRFSRGVFDHHRTDYPLSGGHVRVACTSCHARARSLADLGKAPVECIGCHRDDDEHQGDFGTDCGACHSTATWDRARFEHEFPLDHGDEGRIACRTCHEDGADWKSYTCYGCHEHTPAGIRAEHREEGIVRDLEQCARCHPTGQDHEGERRGRSRSRSESDADSH